MIVKPPPEWYSIYPVRFSRPSVVNDTPQAWAKLEQDYRNFLRELQEAVGCFGAERVERDLRDIIKGPQVRAPDEEFNSLLLAQYDAAAAKGPVDIPEFSRGFYQTHPLGQSAKAIEKRLRRLLKAQKREAERQRKLLTKLKRPSLLNEGTE
jgi:hypothetical protein